jgi:hypothetical protein
LQKYADEERHFGSLFPLACTRLSLAIFYIYVTVMSSSISPATGVKEEKQKNIKLIGAGLGPAWRRWTTW